MKLLERAVEIVDDADVEAVDVDARASLGDLQLERPGVIRSAAVRETGAYVGNQPYHGSHAP
jgi:hypothetical protein